MEQAQQSAVRRRRVFYIPGYDPIHPRRYRELYRKESAEQADISGFDIELKPKQGDGPYGWHVEATMDGRPVSSEFEVLIWSDLVRDSMSNSIPATYLQLLRTAWTYIGSGTLWRLMMLRKGPVIAALYPVSMLLTQLLLAGLAGWLTHDLVRWLGGQAPVASNFAFLAAQAVAVLAGVGVAAALLRWFKVLDGRFFAHYLMHDYAHTAQADGAYPPDLEARLKDFGDRVARAFEDDVDEVLVVGHSSGAHLAISMLSDLIRAGRVPVGRIALGLLTLGHVVPMVSFLPGAHRLRNDLQYLSARNDIAWVDVTAPGDGCAFALCDPVSVTGVSPPGKRWPLVFSAAFSQTLSPERWQALRWRFFRVHFQYLCAFDRPGDYDYFRVTAGPLTLAARYAGRPASRSRIDVAVSKYTSVKAA